MYNRSSQLFNSVLLVEHNPSCFALSSEQERIEFRFCLSPEKERIDFHRFNRNGESLLHLQAVVQQRERHLLDRITEKLRIQFFETNLKFEENRIKQQTIIVSEII